MEFTEYSITRSDDLRALLKSNPLWRNKLGLIVLSGSIENHPPKSFWQNELNKLYYACGCDEAASGFFIGVVLGCVWLASDWFRDIEPTLTAFVFAAFLAVGAMLIGKAVGKLMAHRKLKRLITTIIDFIEYDKQ